MKNVNRLSPAEPKFWLARVWP